MSVKYTYILSVSFVIFLLTIAIYFLASKSLGKFSLSKDNLHVTSENSTKESIQKRLVDLYDQGKFTELNRILDSKLKITPGDIELLLHKAQTLAQEASLTFKEKELGDSAMSYVDQALSIDPKSIAALILKGYIYEIQQNYEQAHVYYDQALALDPTDPMVLAQKAHAYYLQGEESLAKKFYQSAYESDSNCIPALTGLAKISANTGEDRKAYELFLRVADLATNMHVKSEAYYSAATIAERERFISLNDLQSLVDLSIDSDPTYAMPLVIQARLLYAFSIEAKDTQERSRLVQNSFAALEEAIRLNPNQSIAHLQLAIQLAILQQPESMHKILKNLPAIIDRDITLSKSEKNELKEISHKLLTNNPYVNK